jgi:hypothetical protein
MITLSLAPSGAIQAFVEPLHSDERGYYLDLPDDGQDFKRLLMQTLLRRAGKCNSQGCQPTIDLASIVAWLEANPPVPKAVKPGRTAKPKATMADLLDFGPPSAPALTDEDFPPF